MKKLLCTVLFALYGVLSIGCAGGGGGEKFIPAPPVKAPVILTEPQDRILKENVDAWWLTCLADQGEYQWEKQEADNSWKNVEGANVFRYDPGRVCRSTDAGKYRCMVKTSGGTTYTRVCVITVVP